MRRMHFTSFTVWMMRQTKEYALRANAIASPEARRILKEAIYIDGCGFWLETNNWMLQEAGVTAVNLTVPLVLEGLGQAVRQDPVDI